MVGVAAARQQECESTAQEAGLLNERPWQHKSERKAVPLNPPVYSSIGQFCAVKSSRGPTSAEAETYAVPHRGW